MRPHSHFLQRLFLLCLFLAAMGGAPSTRANAMPAPASAFELIEAVNSLRAKNGLPAYSVNSILMGIAQSHSDYQSSIGSVTHYGPGGTRPYQRALAAGYSVAGDLSLGGFFSENILAGSGYSAGDVVNVWMGDAPHQNTMLSANLTEVGAGVSCSGNYCYFTLDAAQPGGASVAYTPSSGGATGGAGNAIPTIGAVLLSTPNADGSIQHVVQPGETLWSISLAYKVNFEEIKRLNKLTDNLIYPGDTLIVQSAAPTATATPTGAPTVAATFTPFTFRTATASTPPATSLPPSAPLTDGSGGLVVGVIIVAALIAAGALTAAGARKKPR